MYRINRDKIQELRRYLDKNLAKEFIHISCSYIALPVFFVKKPGSGLQFCVDYQSLNTITIKNWYPLPLIRETLNYLCHAKIYIKLDIIAAFNYLYIWEGDKYLIVFHIRFGLFEYMVMLFGLCNGPTSFQHYINDTLQEYLDNFCTAYLDNILIFSKDKLEYELYIKKVLSRLWDVGLQVDITKLKFYVSEVAYLRPIVTIYGI